MTRRTVTVAVASLVAATMVIAVSGAVALSGERRAPVEQRPVSEDDPPASTTSVPEAESEPPEPGSLEAAVAEAKAFVAETRGHAFVRDVEVELLSDDDFRARLLEDVEEERDDAEADVDERVLRALHLIEPDVDLVETLEEFVGDSVVGFYDPETDELVLRGTKLSPYVRSTLVHELTHALDDQLFELHRPEFEEADDESFLAFQALTEGNAVRVESAYQEGFSDEEWAALAAEEDALIGEIDYDDVPQFMIDSVSFPYTSGPLFVETLLMDGGEERVDEAFEDPPTTSEHIIDPARWLDGEDMETVAEPEADGEVIDEGSYGMLALLLTLTSAVSPAEAYRAADGWDGDWYVAWDEADQTCVRVVFAMDSEDDLEQLDAALVDWAEDHGDAMVERSGDLVGFTACG